MSTDACTDTELHTLAASYNRACPACETTPKTATEIKAEMRETARIAKAEQKMGR